MSETQPAYLPKLRNEVDISLRRVEGTVIAQLYDPIRNRFFELSDKGTQLLRFWNTGTVDRLVAKLKSENIAVDTADIQEFQTFLATNNLITTGDNSKLLLHQVALKMRWTMRIANLIFFRLRLGNPTAVLDALFPIAKIFYSKTFSLITVLAALVGAFLITKSPHDISYYLTTIISVKGGMLFVVALGMVKFIHELGHAFQARFAGSQVPGCGILFLLGFPLPFTELTDSWRVSSRIDRLKIDAGGLLSEFTLAAWCLFLFPFLVDGPARSLVFYMATISIVLSLAVNLNPLMRFDGYYILSDLLNIKNLQHRSNTLARWHLRETMFALGAPQPENFSRGKRWFLIGYAYSVWVYRFFLYLGIALLAYALFSKVIGVAILLFEVFFFIARPILQEVNIWKRNSMRILTSPRSWITLFIIGSLTAFLFWPSAHKVHFPARVVPLQDTAIVAPVIGKISQHLPSRSFVTQGQAISQIDQDGIAFQKNSIQTQLDQLSVRLSRLSSLNIEQQTREILETQRNELVQELSVLDEQLSLGTILAPHDGIYVWTHPETFENQHVKAGHSLGTIVDFSQARYDIMVSSDWVSKLNKDHKIIFNDTSHQANWPEVAIDQIAQSPISEIDGLELMRPYGGTIPETVGSPDTPKGIWYRVTSQNFPVDHYASIISGQATLRTTKLSYANRIWSRIGQVLIREFSF